MYGGRLVGYTKTDPYCRIHLGRIFPNAKGLRDHRPIGIGRLQLVTVTESCVDGSK
jgi:hypothetical protein